MTSPKQPAPSPIIWFELQIAPLELRLAIMPGQPILFGYSGAHGKPGETWLVRPKASPRATKEIAAGVAELIRRHGVLKTAPHAPERCFQPADLKQSSLHLRLAWKNGKHWATFYPLGDVPPALTAFAEDCRVLGMVKMSKLDNRSISGEQADHEIRPQ